MFLLFFEFKSMKASVKTKVWEQNCYVESDIHIDLSWQNFAGDITPTIQLMK